MNINLQSIHSLTNACRLVGCLPERLRGVADELGVQPVVKINAIDHFDESDLERIRQRLLEQRSESEGVR